MNTVIMCGAQDGNETVNVLFSAIRSCGYSALHVCDKSVSMIPPGAQAPDFIVIDNQHIKNVHTNKGIALFKNRVKQKVELDIPPSFYAVIDSDNSEAVNMLRGDGIQTVVCGLSQKDTVTFSSLENDRAVVSLQRGLKAIDGTDIDPVEVPIAFSGCKNEYPILAAVAVLLLCGAAIPEDGLCLI